MSQKPYGILGGITTDGNIIGPQIVADWSGESAMKVSVNSVLHEGSLSGWQFGTQDSGTVLAAFAIRGRPLPQFTPLATIAVDLISDQTIAGSKTYTGLVTFTDSMLTIIDNDDPTKMIKFNLGNIGAGQTRTIGLPDSGGQMVLDTSTVTLTHKTMTLGTNTITGTKAQLNTAITDGDVVFVGDTVGWTSITGTPTTIAGYGITDGMDLSTNQTIAGTKTFSNVVKITAPNLRLLDSTDITKIATFDTSPIATGTTRTYGLPDIGSSNLVVDKGSQTIAGTKTFTGSVILPMALVSALGVATAGKVAFATDANTTATLGLGLVVVGGGSNFVPVYADGTNWRIG